MRTACEERFVSKRRSTGGFGMAIFLGVGACGLAPAAETDNATDQLQEVIVTAQRHEESLQKASLTIQVIGPDQVRQAGSPMSPI